MAKKNLLDLAKSGSKTTAKKPATRKPAARKTTRKPAAKKPVAKKPEPTKQEIRDKKAKETVTELLSDVDLTLEKKDDLLELDEAPEAGDANSVEWLQEQVTLLTQANEQLKSDLEAAQIGAPAAGEGAVKQSVVGLFNEIQENHIKLGTNPQTGVGNFRIYCPGFLDRMIRFFPFLAEHKRYQ